MSRELGIKEQFAVHANEVVPLNIVTVFELSQVFSHKQLSEGLNYLLKKFQVLNISVKSGMLIEHEMPLETMIHDFGQYSEAAYQQVIFNETHTPIDIETGPLLRVGYFKRADTFDLILSFSHIVVDAKAAFLLAVDYIHYLAYKQSSVVFPHSFYPLAPPLETLLAPFAQGDSAVPYTMLTQTQNLNIKVYPIEDLHTAHFIEQFNSEKLRAITHYAKQHELSFASVMGAAAVLAMYRYIKQQEALSGAIVIDFFTMVDLRRYFIDQTQLIGNFVMPISMSLVVDEQINLIDLAAAIKQQQNHHPDLHANLATNSSVLRPRVGLTSIGVIDALLAPIGNLVKSLWAYNAVHAFFNHNYSISVGSMTYHDSSFLRLSYPCPAMNVEQVKLFNQNLVDLL